MFCDESNDIPYLRFPQFTEVWKQIKLKDLADRVTRRNKGNKTNLALTIAAKNGLVDQTSFFNKQIAAVDMSNYYHVCNGDFAYNKSYSIDYPWGAVKRLDKYPEGALSTLYFCFRPFGSVNSDYLVHYFETTKWHKGISDISGEGARNHGLLNMSIIDYFDTEHSVPENLEQGKIASFLNLLSQRLLTEKGTLKKYQQQKTYFLINLFI
jgi:type I restriction enzyme S subunit